jgi:hypothetical protein
MSEWQPIADYDKKPGAFHKRGVVVFTFRPHNTGRYELSRHYGTDRYFGMREADFFYVIPHAPEPTK